MKKIVIEFPEKYSDIMSVTLVGGAGSPTINGTTGIYDLNKGTHFIATETGPWIQWKDGDLDQRDRNRGRWEELRNSHGELDGWIHAGCGCTSLSRHKFCPSCGAYMWGDSND